MKKILFLLFSVLLLSGCSKEYSGEVTVDSSKYLDKGYMVNIIRDIEKLGEDSENYGKGYVRMTFNVISEYVSTHDFDEDANYNIKKKVVSNIKIISGPKKGMAEELYGNYNTYDSGIALLGTNNKFEENYSIPHSSGGQSSIAVTVNKIALFDSSVYGYYETPSLSEVYSDLGISREDVTLTLGFRVELITVDNRIFYKDYEIQLPPSTYDISGSEFYVDLTIDDVNLMEPFLEKN